MWISRGEMGAWGDGASVCEPSGLDEPRRIEPVRGRTDRGAWWSRPWSRGGCWRWGSGSSRSPPPTAPRSGSRRAPAHPLFHRRRHQPDRGVQPGHPRLHRVFRSPTATIGPSSYITTADQWRPVLHRVRQPTRSSSSTRRPTSSRRSRSRPPASGPSSSRPVPTAISTSPRPAPTSSSSSIRPPASSRPSSSRRPTAGPLGSSRGPTTAYGSSRAPRTRSGNSIRPRRHHGIAHPEHGRRRLHDHDRRRR